MDSPFCCKVISSVPFVALVAACLLLPHPAFAEPSEQPIAVATHESLHSKVLNKDRVVDVYVPPGYAKGNERYPVLYLLDGNGHFRLREAADAGRRGRGRDGHGRARLLRL